MRTAFIGLFLSLGFGMLSACSPGIPEEPEGPAPPAVEGSRIEGAASGAGSMPTVEEEVGKEPPPYPTPPETAARSLEDLRKAPTYTPFTARPDITNRWAVSRALEREYPPALRDAGIGGTTQVWLFIDGEGNVLEVQVNESSGRRALDLAAARVARLMEFTPAINKDRPVPVWISIPVTFTVRRSR